MRVVYRRRCSARPLFWLCCLLCFPCALPSLCYSLALQHQASSSASPASSSLPLSPSVDICVPASAPLFSTPSPLIPVPHTLSVLVLWAACMCMHSTPNNFFFPIPTSHLTAYYCSYPRRGLTAGNINRTARTDMHTHMQTHTEPLILGRPRTEHLPPHTYRPPFSMSHNYANRLAAARYPPEIALYSAVYVLSVSIITPYLTF